MRLLFRRVFFGGGKPGSAPPRFTAVRRDGDGPALIHRSYVGSFGRTVRAPRKNLLDPSNCEAVIRGCRPVPIGTRSPVSTLMLSMGCSALLSSRPRNAQKQRQVGSGIASTIRTAATPDNIA